MPEMLPEPERPQKSDDLEQDLGAKSPSPHPPTALQEIGGQKGPEPTRFGDWEKGGRCTDF